MPQIRISELESTSIGSGDVPIVQNGETLKYDITNKAESATVRTLELDVQSLNRTVDNLQTDLSTKTVQFVTGNRDINFGTMLIPLTGYVYNSSKSLCFWLPWASANTGYYTVKDLSLTLFAEGTNPCVRSGTNGNTYTRLDSANTYLWRYGSEVRTNEILNILIDPFKGMGFRFIVHFEYPIAKTSDNPTAIQSLVPIGIAKNGLIITRSE